MTDKPAPGEVTQESVSPPDGEMMPEDSSGHTLSDLAGDGFVFFTPALILTHGLFDRDPLVEFRRANPDIDDDASPFVIDCEYPFFQGIGHSVMCGQFVNWDHRIYGVHSSIWPRVHQFVTSLGLFEPARYHYAKVGWHPLQIVDPTTLHSGRLLPDLPVIEVTVFCVSSYRAFAYIEQAADPPRTLPYLNVQPPKPEIVKEAEALLGPPSNPKNLAELRKGLSYGQD